MDVFNQKKFAFIILLFFFGIIFLVQIFNEPFRNNNGMSMSHQLSKRKHAIIYYVF